MIADLEARVKDSIVNAVVGRSKLDSTVLDLDGMSSPKVRRLLNNLCSYAGVSYLEVGCWKGATAISALFGNRDSVIEAHVIDNFSEFNEEQNVEGMFFQNIERFREQITRNFHFHNCDTLLFDTALVGTKVTVFFYDGAHDTVSQRSAIVHYAPVLANPSVLVVDDWNWEMVRKGVRSGLEESHLEVLNSWELPASGNQDKVEWWNGLFVGVVAK